MWECGSANPSGEQSIAKEMLGRSPLIRVTAVGVGVEKKSGTGSESEPPVFNLLRTFHAEGRNQAEIPTT